MQILMEASKGLSVTFHRAFDVCRNPQKALEEIIELGCNRILTSGQQPTAEQGIGLLKELQGLAAGRITLLAGCGVNENNIARIAAETGINELHFSARESIQSEMKFRNEVVSMGGTVLLLQWLFHHRKGLSRLPVFRHIIPPGWHHLPVQPGSFPLNSYKSQFDTFP